MSRLLTEAPPFCIQGGTAASMPEGCRRDASRVAGGEAKGARGDERMEEQDRDRLERHLEYELKKRGLTRRDLMKGGTGMASVLGLGRAVRRVRRRRRGRGRRGDRGSGHAPRPAASPQRRSRPFTGTLVSSGSASTCRPPTVVRVPQPGAPVAEEAEAALGFTVEFTVKTTTEMEQIALTQPGVVRRLLGLPLPVRPHLAVGQLPARSRSAKAHRLGADQQPLQARARSTRRPRAARSATATHR